MNQFILLNINNSLESFKQKTLKYASYFLYGQCQFLCDNVQQDLLYIVWFKSEVIEDKDPEL